MGKTYFLANLATFGITGGLLARHGAEGIANWIKVIGGTISGIQEGWARWVDGEPDEDDDDEMVGVEDSDAEDDEDDKPRGSRTQVVVLGGPSVSQFAPPPRITPKRLRRGPPLPPNIRSKLVLLTSSQHLSILAQHATRASTSASTNPLLDFAVFVSGLLNAFKGSPRWEAILEVLIDDGNKQNKQLVKTLWREGVRGRWRNSSDKSTWDTFAKSEYCALSITLLIVTDPNTPCLVFMTLLYNHYLLITPDDEFFDSNGKNPLTIDEVLDLAGIWRDLAFWSYMNGVEAAGAQGRGSEDQRNLLTRGVVRVAEKK
jgi:ubiquitin-protein ligase E3 C